MKTHSTESLKNRIHGWLPKEPLLKGHSATAPVRPEVKAVLEQELSKKLIKAISITNPIIGGVYFASSLSSHIRWSLETAVLTSAGLALVLLVTNVLIYLYLKHQTVAGEV